MNNSSTVLPDNITTPESGATTDGRTVITTSNDATGHAAPPVSAPGDDSKTVVGGQTTHNPMGAATPNMGVSGGAPSTEATQLSNKGGDKTEVATNGVDEKTQCNPKATDAPVSVDVNVNNSGDMPAEEPKSSSRVGKIVAGAVGGVLLGSVAAYAAVHSMKSGSPVGVENNDLNVDDTIDAEPEVDVKPEDVEREIIVDDDIEADEDILQIMEDDGLEYVELTADEESESQGGLADVISKIVDKFTGESTDNTANTVAAETMQESVDPMTEEIAEENVAEDIAEEGVVEEKVAEDSSDVVASEEPVEQTSSDAEPVQEVSFANDVNDDMSFNEAFAAARAEVGAGGAFEWRGNIYGTYYADEWNNMSDDEKDAFGRSFDFGGADSDYGKEDVADVVVEDDNVDITEVVDDEDNIEILGLSEDDVDMEIELLDDDDVVMVDVDAFDDDDDIIDLTEDAIFDDDMDVVENLFDDADDGSWGDSDIFA